MRRFRPNFVIETHNSENDTSTLGELPFQEDNFSELYIGSVGFDVSFCYTKNNVCTKKCFSEIVANFNRWLLGRSIV